MSFMDKFNMLLNEFNVTNIEFATKSHINSTLISKYRNGKRIPSENSDTVKKISKTFLEIAENKNMKTYIRNGIDLGYIDDREKDYKKYI